MKRLFLSLAVLASCGMAAAAQAYGDGRTIDVDSVWGNPRVNEVNRAPMHVTMDIGNLPVVSLHGTWKFNWVENAWDRPEDYYRTDYDDKGWGTIPVPGMWELNGYGEPVYVSPDSRTMSVLTAAGSKCPQTGTARISSPISAR